MTISFPGTVARYSKVLGNRLIGFHVKTLVIYNIVFSVLAILLCAFVTSVLKYLFCSSNLHHRESYCSFSYFYQFSSILTRFLIVIKIYFFVRRSIKWLKLGSNNSSLSEQMLNWADWIIHKTILKTDSNIFGVISWIRKDILALETVSGTILVMKTDLFVFLSRSRLFKDLFKVC